jgi:hypothetical protein
MIDYKVNTEFITLSAMADGKDISQLCSLEEDICKLKLTLYPGKESPLLLNFNSIIRRMIETGLLDKLSCDLKVNWRYAYLSETGIALDSLL